MCDLKALSDGELVQITQEAHAERERRDRIATAPERITAIREQYVEDGGDISDLP